MASSVLLIVFATIIIETALATYVAVRAWGYRPTAYFLVTMAALATLHIGSLPQPDRAAARLSGALAVLSVGALNLGLLLLFSALFVPAWWRDRHPIRWIMLPNLVALALLAIDLIGGLERITTIQLVGGVYQPISAQPGGRMMLLLLTASWLVHLAILGRAFVHNQRVRPAIVVLAVAIIWGVLLAWLDSLLVPLWLSDSSRLLQTLPFVAALAYSVLQARLFEPTSAAIDLALRSMSDALAVLDTDGTVVYANQQAARLALQPGRLLDETLVAAGVPHSALADLATQQQAGSDPASRSPQTLNIAGRSYNLALTPLTDSRGRLLGSVLLGRDMTEVERQAALLEQERARLAELVQQLKHLASHDPLTALPNRRSFEEALERVVSRSQRGYHNVLLFIDLDNFKLVNDSLGHSAGDQVLISLSWLLADELREGDVLARLGGDEFAVLLEDVQADEALRIAERLRSTVEAFCFTVGGRTFDLSLSMGLVVLDQHYDTQLALARADMALYTAKEHGRNRVVCYETGTNQLDERAEAHQWVATIKAALREDRLLLHFQPVRRLDTGRVAHYEALIRLHDEHGTLISSSAFIPAAERFDLMPEIDRWLIRNVLQALQHDPELRICVNLSGRSLTDQTLLAEIEAAIQSCGIAPDRLGFELNEAAVVRDLQRAERWMRRLKALGCWFALDDFGMGCASFAQLRALPVDQVKIDGSFISTLERDASSRAIVEAIHSLSHALGKATVAEFVESAASLAILHEIGIPYGQGYYLGAPAPVGGHPVPAQTRVAASG